MFDELRRILSRTSADYADIRYELKRESKLAFDGRELTLMTANTTDGYVLRVLKEGGLATVAFTRLDDADKALQTAEENAVLIGRRVRQPVRLAPVAPEKAVVHPELNIDPRTVPLDEKLTLLRQYNEIPLAHQQIATTSLSYQDLIREKFFLSTEGTEIQEDLATCRINGVIVSKDGTLTQQVRVGFGGSDGFYRLANRHAEVEARTRLAVDLLQAQPVTGGTYSVVLNPRLAGVFTHEAFGHFSEADIIEDLPTMREKMTIGAELGTGILNIKDDPTLPNQLGHYRYDDEGVAARPVQLMKNGVLTGRLHSRRTAAAFGEPLTGHCVAEDFRYAPIIRMGCIFIEPHKGTRDELLAELGDGLYLIDAMGGQTTGENFTFGAQYGYVVHQGKPGAMIRDINMTGNLYHTLKNIRAIAEDLQLGEIGGCGKGQLNLRSCYGAPHILVSDIVIGGR